MVTLVVGLGNPMLTDDGVGVLVARAVELALPTRVESQVEVVEASVGGLRLMEMMVGYDRVILVDALMGCGEAPGALLRWTLADMGTMAPTQHMASAHDATLPTALEAGRRLGLQVPNDVIVFAIAAQNVVEFGGQPTAAVMAAVPLAAAAVLAELASARPNPGGASTLRLPRRLHNGIP
jgi:hydrogenase maturation protease